MKYRKWTCLLLALALVMAMAVPALADGEAPMPAPEPEQEAAEEGMEAPPPAMVLEDDGLTEDAPVEEVPVEEVPSEDVPVEEAPVEEAPVEEAPAPEIVLSVEENSDEPEAASAETADAPETVSFTLPAGGVSVTVKGPMSAIDELSFYAPGGEKYDNPYNILSGGLYYWYDPDHDGLGERVNVTSDRPSKFNVYPGTEMIVLMDPNYDVTISSGTVERNIFYLDHGPEDNGIDQRLVNLTAPSSGSMTITVSPITKPLPRKIPFTSYGGGASGGFECAVVHDEKEFGFWCLYEEDMTGFGYGDVYTGTTICFELKQGYTIEVLKGGKVTRVGGFFYPTLDKNAVGVDIRVDDDATEFCYAIVKQGEHFKIPEKTTSGFIDVAKDSWYADTVNEALAKGVVKADSTGRFSPNSAGTRGQTITMLYRAMGSPYAGTGVFSDTSGEVASAAAWAASVGVTKGVSSTSFDPNGNITREQLVTMLYRLAGSPDSAAETALASYSDGGSVHDYAAPAVAWALQNGVLTGYGDGTIRPGGAATRAEICALVMRFAG